MTTLLCRHTEEYLQKSRFSRYLQYFRDVGPSDIVTKPTSGLCELDLGISEGFRENLQQVVQVSSKQPGRTHQSVSSGL